MKVKQMSYKSPDANVARFVKSLNFKTEKTELESSVEPAHQLNNNSGSVDLDNPPEGVVAGSNVIQLSAVQNAEVRSAITLSIAASQLYADTSDDVSSPDIWAAKYIYALSRLGWTNMSYNYTEANFDKVDAEVHKEIIPLLSAILGPAAVASASVIIKALESLKNMDSDSPWIKLYGKESSKVSATQFQFSLAETVGGIANLKTVGLRLDAEKKVQQVLFFKLKSEKAGLKTVNFESAQGVDLLLGLNPILRPKIEDDRADFIASFA